MPDDIDNGEHGVDVPLPQSAAGAGQPVNPASPGAVPPTGTLVSSSIPPRPPPIDTPQSPFRCAELPVELALAIFEQCDKNTQLNICRVSKGIRSITIGVLFRDIVLEFDMDTSENKILQTLRWINQVAAEHCQSFGIDTKNIEYFLGGTIVDVNRDPTTVEPAELPIDEPTRIMGEIYLLPSAIHLTVNY